MPGLCNIYGNEQGDHLVESNSDPEVVIPIPCLYIGEEVITSFVAYPVDKPDFSKQNQTFSCGQADFLQDGSQRRSRDSLHPITCNCPHPPESPDCKDISTSIWTHTYKKEKEVKHIIAEYTLYTLERNNTQHYFNNSKYIEFVIYCFIDGQEVTDKLINFFKYTGLIKIV